MNDNMMKKYRAEKKAETQLYLWKAMKRFPSFMALEITDKKS